nr:hypothetical protein CFP56_71529 [Quercus suber]
MLVKVRDMDSSWDEGVKHEGGYEADSISCFFRIEDGFTWVVTRVYKVNDDVGKAEIGEEFSFMSSPPPISPVLAVDSNPFPYSSSLHSLIPFLLLDPNRSRSSPPSPSSTTTNSPLRTCMAPLPQPYPPHHRTVQPPPPPPL